MENRIYMNTNALSESIDTLENLKLKNLIESLESIKDSVRPKLDEFMGEHAESYFKLVEEGYSRVEEAVSIFSQKYTTNARADHDRTVYTMNKSADSANELLSNIGNPDKL